MWREWNGTRCVCRRRKSLWVSSSGSFCSSRRRQPGCGSASTIRLWQNTPSPTAAAKPLNPRKKQRISRNARFRPEIVPSIPARKACQCANTLSTKSCMRRGIASVPTCSANSAILLLRRAEALVGRQHLRPSAEELLVSLDHRLGQLAVGLLMFIDLVVGDELLRAIWHSSTLWPNSTGFSRRPRLISSVCGSKRLKTRSDAGTFSPSICARRAVATTFSSPADTPSVPGPPPPGRGCSTWRVCRRSPRRSPRSSPSARSACGSCVFTSRWRAADLLGM